MKKQVVSVCAVMGLLGMLSLPTTQARPRWNPTNFAERCMNRVEAIAQRSLDRIEQQQADAVDDIQGWLDAGDTDRAEQTAVFAIFRVRMIERMGVRSIGRAGRWCVWLLYRLGMSDLADEVSAVCEEAMDQIEAAAELAVDEINATLATESDDGDGDDDWYPPE